MRTPLIVGLTVVLAACSGDKDTSTGSLTSGAGAGTAGANSVSSGSSGAMASGAGGAGGSGGAILSGPLPIDLPPQTVLKASPHKAFAHYFPPYPISIDNKDGAMDYYATQYLTPGGENNKHIAYGGLLRQRPLPRAVDPSMDWAVDDMKTEVMRATSAGLDGFTVDVLGLTGSNWTHLETLLQAAPLADPAFKIVLMPDGTGSDVADSDALATAFAGLVTTYGTTLMHLDDGRLVISPFYPEKQGAAWWQTWVTTMKTAHNIDVALVPCFLNYGANADAFAPFSYGFSNWGNRSPAANMNLAGSIQDAHTRGKIWMQPVSVQDERPYASIYTEADNSENLRTTWTAAVGGADWVQMPTWNDYSEGAEVAPSTGTGWSPLDISSYYLTQWKTGQTPTIVRDVIYVSHRVQLAGAPVTQETKPMTLTGGGATRDDVEVLTFLVDAATIEVTIGGQVQTYDAPAGVSAKLFPLQAGAISAKATRNGSEVASIASPYTVTLDSVSIQDEGYRFVSSGRGN